MIIRHVAKALPPCDMPDDVSRARDEAIDRQSASHTHCPHADSVVPMRALFERCRDCGVPRLFIAAQVRSLLRGAAAVRLSASSRLAVDGCKRQFRAVGVSRTPFRSPERFRKRAKPAAAPDAASSAGDVDVDVDVEECIAPLAAALAGGRRTDSVPDQGQRQAEDGRYCIVRLDGERCDIARTEVGSPPVRQGIDRSALVRLATAAWARRHRVQGRRL